MAQQTRLLLLQGITNPDPKQKFITDLIWQIQQWWASGHKVPIGMDANKDVDNPWSKLRAFSKKLI